MQKNKISNKTLALKKAALNFFFKELLKKDLIKFKTPKAERKIPEVLTKEEVKSLIENADNVKSRLIISMLYSSGITITYSLELCEGIVMSQKVTDMIHQAKMIIYSGKKLSDSLKAHKKIVPNIMIKIIEAGERSGSLEESLREVAFFLDYQVTHTLKTLTTLIEPVMLVIVGGMVGGMMLAIIAPIYGLIGQVGAH